ncbi:SirB2 family protein [Roseateles sp. BYS78W]|uniref:SirB2 family protein n=1 Tax=Pelomonas candidula TaxID=3299025 RepID=A0ABW7HF71_9BURK
MDYFTVKLIHQCAVALSITGFFVRGAASLAGAGWVNSRAARTLPHLVDSVLLLSALTLAGLLHLTPDRAPWLAAKLVGLLLYIGLGVVALKPGRPVAVRAVAWVAALAVVGWIVSVAVTKNPLGFLAAVVGAAA